MAELAWGASTHPGQIRAQNEDHLYASNGIYVVADGMGGHEAGEVASELAVDRIREALEANDEAPTAANVVEAITGANGDIFRAAIATPGQAGMGTTVTVIAVVADPMAGRGEPNIDDNDPIERGPDGSARVTPVVPREQPEALVLANVGDSRTYLYRHSRLRRVTVDHSYVQELVSTGHITDDEARTHPRRNIITRALGIEPDVKVDWWTLPLVRGDRFLLCSDGLVDEIPDADITATLKKEPDPQKAVDSLVEQANAAGGRDNITVIVVDVLDGDDPPDPTQELDLTPKWADDPTEEAPRPNDDADSKRPRRKRRRDRHDDDADADTTTADTPAALLSADGSDDAAEGAAEKSKPKLTRAIGVFVVLALLIAGFVALAAWARRGYFVDFDNDDQVVVFQGRPDGLLWFEPTAETSGGLSRDDLTDDSVAEVDDRPTFSSLADAAEFVRDLEQADDRRDPSDNDADGESDADANSDSNGDGDEPSESTRDTEPPNTDGS